MVNIYTSRTVTERVQPFGAFFGDPAPRFRNRTERSLGSGVIVDTEGHIATNNHVIETPTRYGCSWLTAVWPWHRSSAVIRIRTWRCSKSA